MTKRERAQVVELLRCGADLAMQRVFAPMSRAGERLDIVNSPIEDLADRAILETTECSFSPDPAEMWPEFGEQCLEAALRVEQGEWP